MLDLIVSLLFSTANATLLKHGEVRGADRLGVMGVNYILASLLAGYVWHQEGSVIPSNLTIGLGLMGGIFFVGVLFIWLSAIAHHGMAVSTAIMRLGVVWPILISVIFFSETPTALQLTGIGLALSAVFLFTAGQTRLKTHLERDRKWLVVLFFMAGGPATTLKVFTELGAVLENHGLLMVIFLFSGVLCWTMIFIRGKMPGKKEWETGTAFGIFNMLANFFLLRGLKQVPGVVAFPFANAGVLLLAAITGVIFWGERPGRMGYFAIAAAAIATALTSQ